MQGVHSDAISQVSNLAMYNFYCSAGIASDLSQSRRIIHCKNNALQRLKAVIDGLHYGMARNESFRGKVNTWQSVLWHFQDGQLLSCHVGEAS